MMSEVSETSECRHCGNRDVVKQLAMLINVDFDHHCDLCLVKGIINSRHVPHHLTTLHHKIM